MKTKRATISISKLARYASNPESIFDKVNAGATRYGNRAHAAIGKGPSIAMFICLAALLLAAAKLLGVI